MKKKTVYMLTVVYTGGRVLDIEFNTIEDRTYFVASVNFNMCVITFWDKEVTQYA